MKVYILFSLFVLFTSCSKYVTKENDRNITVCDTIIAGNQNIAYIQLKSYVDLDSIKNEILVLKENSHISDSVKYKFSLEDVGSEGNEGIAYYLNDTVQKIEIDIFTSMWKIHLLYLFDKKYVRVTECTYNIVKAYSGGDPELIKTLSYITDRTGVPINKTDNDRVNIFQELESTVPFTLK